jgi:CDP-glucose 4,6-dehydratase
MNRSFWKGKRVFLTGHTGFKGGWLTLWLSDMGAIVHGYSLTPPTTPNFFSVCNLQNELASSTIADIRDYSKLAKAIKDADPEIIFHLAAQSLVRESYSTPLETYAVNVMGTAHLLEATRHLTGIKAIINVTTDKCYENLERELPYKETEALGGFDPYSSSKACAELVSSAYRRSFLNEKEIHLATARAGNVIGGGDWATDRLLPDFLRSLDAGHPLMIRSPKSVRPWQHVLEPLSGYLNIAEKIYHSGSAFAEAWNFGPETTDSKPVEWLVDQLCKMVPGSSWHLGTAPTLHEAKQLKLDSSKAKNRLEWKPRWDLTTALSKTVDWHQAWKNQSDMRKISIAQIHFYEGIEAL